MTDHLLGYVARNSVSVSVPKANLDPRFNRDLVRISDCTCLFASDHHVGC